MPLGSNECVVADHLNGFTHSITIFILSLSEIVLQLKVSVSLLSPAVKLNQQTFVFSEKTISLVYTAVSSHVAWLPSVHYTSMDVYSCQ